jgi:hypothetical protein
MPRPKRMDRKQEEIDRASEALLEDLVEKGAKKEEREAKNDDPFTDDDGDLKVVPTMEELSALVAPDGSVNAIPMVEILRRNLRVTLRAIEMAEIAYHALPRQGTATALTQMQNMARDLMKGIEEHQDPEIFAEEIADLVIKPLVFEFVKVLTSEADKKRSALMTVVPPESAPVVRHEMADLLQGVSRGMDEAFDGARRRLSDMLGARKGK